MDTQGLWRLFEELDRLIRARLNEAGRSGVRGLHLDVAEVQAEFAEGEVDQSGLQINWGALAESYPPLASLARIHRLSPDQVALIVVAAAPELAPRYARAFALLQDDVGRRRPGFDFALSLLERNDAKRLSVRLKTEGPEGLIGQRFASLDGDGPRSEAALVVDPQVLRYLGLQGDLLDARLAENGSIFPTIANKGTSLLPAKKVATLRTFARGRGHALFVRTDSPAVARTAAGLVGAEYSRSVLEVEAESSVDPLLFARECALFRHIPLIRCVSSFPPSSEMVRRVRNYGLPVLFYGVGQWTEPPAAPCGPVQLDLRELPLASRRKLWDQSLPSSGRATPKKKDLDLLAERFSLSPEATAAAAAEATASVEKTSVPFETLARAARRQTGHALGKLATRIVPSRDWNDLVVSEETETRLREISARLRHTDQVLNGWGFAKKSRQARRTAALFAGPSGTGKTLSAEIIARDLGADLYRVDLAQVFDKYVGETEKNLDRIFAAAELQDCLLFLDECDVLLGKRSEQREGRDKYANLEAAYLLQRVDEFHGVVLMATNLLTNVDGAFIRRLDFVVHFTFPDEVQCARLWKQACPKDLPLADDVDFGALANEHRLSGGNIANCVLSAAFLAAQARESVVTQAMLEHSVRREYQKMGQGGDRR